MFKLAMAFETPFVPRELSIGDHSMLDFVSIELQPSTTLKFRVEPKVDGLGERWMAISHEGVKEIGRAHV